MTDEQETPNLDRFIAAEGDEARLALGREVLEAAWQEAEHLQGWQEQVYEYVVALRDGKGLNRPLGQCCSHPEHHGTTEERGRRGDGR